MAAVGASQRKELRVLFEELDRNGDGTLSPFEVATLLRACGEKVTEYDISDLFAKIDVGASGGDGRIDFDEFCVMMAREYTSGAAAAGQRRESLLGNTGIVELEGTFGELDRDGDGRLSAHDLAGGLGITSSEAEEMIREVDSEGRGSISKRDFIQAMSP